MTAERVQIAGRSRSSLADDVAQRLVDLILAEGLRPGDKLPSERELTARLSVGRSSLREAVKTLTAFGVVEVNVGSGTYVAAGETSLLTRPLSWSLLIGEHSTRDVIEARRIVEVELAGLAAERATDAELDALAEKLALMSVSLENAEAFARHDLEFHLAIARAAHNQVLYQVMDTLRHVLREWFVKAFPWGDSSVLMARHRRIHDAIRARDVDAARREVAEHIAGGARWLLETMERTRGNGGAARPDGSG
ncbi:MAG TPA: FadR/GntR family transcriptional regulator [Chloroflexota bacterium]|jgi:GntR family transcriptional repressor for pyruvate dehydrogenase complex